jgi:hypothetical protein
MIHELCSFCGYLNCVPVICRALRHSLPIQQFFTSSAALRIACAAGCPVSTQADTIQYKARRLRHCVRVL